MSQRFDVFTVTFDLYMRDIPSLPVQEVCHGRFAVTMPLDEIRRWKSGDCRHGDLLGSDPFWLRRLLTLRILGNKASLRVCGAQLSFNMVFQDFAGFFLV